MKTLSDFKRRLKPGILLHTIHTRLGDFGIRKVSIVQTNSFALKTIMKDFTENDSWCQYPKASDFEVVDNDTVKIYWGQGEKREHILTYKFVTDESH